MKLDFSKLDFKKLHSYMFLAGVVLSVIASLITSLCFDYGFWTLFLISVVLVAIFFYRFNNGLIALLFGEFGVSMFKKHKYVFKHHLTEAKTEELLNAVQYGEKSIIVHRKNTKSYYQIVKRKNSFFIKKCSAVVLNNMITDFDNSRNYKGKKNVEIMFHTIKEIWYTVDTDNETVLYISNGKRKFPLVPEFPIELSKLEEFLCFNNNIDELFKATPASEFEKVQNEHKNSFVYNVVTLFSSVFVIQCFAAGIPNTNLWCAICKLILICSLWYFSVLSFIKPEKYFYYNMFTSEKGNRSGYEYRQILIVMVALLITVFVSIIDLSKMLTISAIVFIITLVILFPKLLRKKKNNTKSANVQILVACVFLALTSFVTVFFINNMYIREKITTAYSVTSYYYDDGSYYAYILVDGKEYSVNADSYDYKEKIPHVEATRVTGLLGIEYIV